MTVSDNRHITPDPIEEIGLSDFEFRARFGVPFGRIEEAVEQLAVNVTAPHGRRPLPVRLAAA